MSVWLTIPSARPPEEAEPLLRKWAERGYKIALWRDDVLRIEPYDYIHFDPIYPGYAAAVNGLIERVRILDESAEWFIAAGDDVEPDPNRSAGEIARELGEYFGTVRDVSDAMSAGTLTTWGTFGVMQPTGDRWGSDAWSRSKWPDAPAYIDRICGSAWIGREFARRMYGGRGPLFEGYRHMFVDEELQNVARKMGVFWQRRDLTQYHHHWMRTPGKTERDCPEFLKPVSVGEAGRRHWAEYEALFKSRQAAGFPGHEPIA